MDKGSWAAASKWSKGIIIALGIVLGLLLLVLAAAQIVLSPKFLSKTVDKYAPAYIEGDLAHGKIRLSLLGSFPHASIDLSDVAITYPHEMFARYDFRGRSNPLRSEGQGPDGVDTLLSFSHLHGSLDYLDLLAGKITIHKAEVSKARIFAHSYDSTTANWGILPIQGDTTTTQKDSSSTKVVIRHVVIDDSPHIVFTSLPDGIFASLGSKSIKLEGKVDITDIPSSRINLEVDSLRLDARFPQATVGLDLSRLHIRDRRRRLHVDLSSRTLLGLPGLGTFDVPIDLSTKLFFPECDFSSISFRDLEAKVDMLDLSGEGDVRLEGDSTYLRAELLSTDCPVGDILQKHIRRVMPQAGMVKTDAKVSLTLLCDGYWVPSTSALPSLVGELLIPRSSVQYTASDYKGSIAALIEAQTDPYGKLSVSADELDLDVMGVHLWGNGSVDDLLGRDFLAEVDIKGRTSLDVLNDFLPEGMAAEGAVDAGVKGMILRSDMDPYNFSGADIEAYLRSDEVTFVDEKDTLAAHLSNVDFTLEKLEDGFLRAGALGLKGSIDSLYATYGKDLRIRGRELSLTAQNAKETTSEEYGEEVHPIVGNLSAGRLALFTTDSSFVGARGMSNTFKLSTSKALSGEETAPILSLGSHSRNIYLRHPSARVGLSDVGMDLSAVMTRSRRKERREHILDSLAKEHPGIPRDSLIRATGLGRRRLSPDREIPEYLLSDDFKGSDLNIQVGESLSQYIRDWDIKGKVRIDSGAVTTPLFPLVNTIHDFQGSVTNNEVRISNMTIRSGESDVTGSGTLSGLRMALLRNAPMDLDLRLASRKINANELLSAYDAGVRNSKTGREDSSAMDEGISDGEYLRSVAAESLGETTLKGSPLIVIPANLRASIALEGNEIDYSNLVMNWFASDIRMQDRCLQITNTVATSNMGDIYFEGFYATKTKKDITAGFDLNLVDITAEKVIELIPAVDSIIPMLKSFSGMLDCEIAATSRIDTMMNIVPSSISGIMSIKGSDLLITENEALRSIAKTLLFKDRKEGHIDDMSVQGIIGDNTLEVFPFVLGIDRYQLAISGTQNFDQSFKYHASVLKSPLPFRIGINVTGNFDRWKISLVKPKYKNTSVPVFTTQINDMQYNLVSSIHDIFTRGVETAVSQTERDRLALESSRREAGEATDMETQDESLSPEELSQLDSLAREEELDSLSTARKAQLSLSSMDEDIDKALADRIDALASESKAPVQDSKLARSEERKAFKESLKGKNCWQRFKARIQRCKERIK